MSRTPVSFGWCVARDAAGIHVGAVDSLRDSAANRFVLEATVYPSKDSAGFDGYGDADPSNVSPLVRCAEMGYRLIL